MRTSRRAALALALFALSALTQNVPIILSNYGLLHDWASEGFASTAYTNTGCDGRAAPQTINGSVLGLAVRVNLPAIGIYHTCEPEPALVHHKDANGGQVDPYGSLWSISKIAVPLRRSSVTTIQNLSNYQIVFYLDNGVPYPTNIAQFMAALDASNTNGLPLPGAVDITSTGAWFNLSVTAPLVNCPQLLHNASVWVSIVPKAPIYIALDSVNFYDGIIWLGAQGFLQNSYPYSAWSTGAARYITSVVDIGATADTCITPSGIAYVQQPNWASLSVAHVPRSWVTTNVAYGLILYGWANNEGCFPPSPTPSQTRTQSPSSTQSPSQSSSTSGTDTRSVTVTTTGSTSGTGTPSGAVTATSYLSSSASTAPTNSSTAAATGSSTPSQTQSSSASRTPTSSCLPTLTAIASRTQTPYVSPNQTSSSASRTQTASASFSITSTSTSSSTQGPPLSHSPSKTPSMPRPAAGQAVFDNTADLNASFIPSRRRLIATFESNADNSTAFGVSFRLATDPACGPGLYMFTELSLALSALEATTGQLRVSLWLNAAGAHVPSLLVSTALLPSSEGTSPSFVTLPLPAGFAVDSSVDGSTAEYTIVFLATAPLRWIYLGGNAPQGPPVGLLGSATAALVSYAQGASGTWALIPGGGFPGVRLAAVRGACSPSPGASRAATVSSSMPPRTSSTGAGSSSRSQIATASPSQSNSTSPVVGTGEVTGEAGGHRTGTIFDDPVVVIVGITVGGAACCASTFVALLCLGLRKQRKREAASSSPPPKSDSDPPLTPSHGDVADVVAAAWYAEEAAGAASAVAGVPPEAAKMSDVRRAAAALPRVSAASGTGSNTGSYGGGCGDRQRRRSRVVVPFSTDEAPQPEVLPPCSTSAPLYLGDDAAAPGRGDTGDKRGLDADQVISREFDEDGARECFRVPPLADSIVPRTNQQPQQHERWPRGELRPTSFDEQATATSAASAEWMHDAGRPSMVRAEASGSPAASARAPTWAGPGDDGILLPDMHMRRRRSSLSAVATNLLQEGDGGAGARVGALGAAMDWRTRTAAAQELSDMSGGGLLQPESLVLQEQYHQRQQAQGASPLVSFPTATAPPSQGVTSGVATRRQSFAGPPARLPFHAPTLRSPHSRPNPLRQSQLLVGPDESGGGAWRAAATGGSAVASHDLRLSPYGGGAAPAAAPLARSARPQPSLEAPFALFSSSRNIHVGNASGIGYASADFHTGGALGGRRMSV